MTHCKTAVAAMSPPHHIAAGAFQQPQQHIGLTGDDLDEHVGAGGPVGADQHRGEVPVGGHQSGVHPPVCLVGKPFADPAFEVFQRVWGRRGDPPLITVAMVAGLARPDALVELEAVAIVPAAAAAT